MFEIGWSGSASFFWMMRRNDPPAPYWNVAGTTGAGPPGEEYFLFCARNVKCFISADSLRFMSSWNAEFVAGGLGAFGVSPVMKVVRLYIAFIRDGQPASTTAWLPLQFAQESCSGLGISSS